MSFIYLASAYSHDDPMIRMQRAELVRRAAAHLTVQGVTAISPIAYYEAMLAYMPDHGTDYATFKEHCITILEQADGLWILMNEGWTESVGIKNETDHWVNKMGRDEEGIVMLPPDDIDKFVPKMEAANAYSH